MRAIAGADPNYVVSAFNDTGPRAQLLLETSGGLLSGGWTGVAIPMNPVIYGLWRASDGTLFAVGDDDAGTAVFGVRTASSWAMHSIAGCTARAIDGIDPTHAVAVGGCGTRAAAWIFDGAAWTEVARPPIDGPLVAVDMIAGGFAAVGIHGSAIFDGATWSVDADAIGESISATSRSDIWIAGPFTSVQHFDGTAWSRLAITGTSPIEVLARPNRVLFPGAIDGYVELVR
jgi:hypothetical protein